MMLLLVPRVRGVGVVEPALRRDTAPRSSTAGSEPGAVDIAGYRKSVCVVGVSVSVLILKGHLDC